MEPFLGFFHQSSKSLVRGRKVRSHFRHILPWPSARLTRRCRLVVPGQPPARGVSVRRSLLVLHAPRRPQSRRGRRRARARAWPCRRASPQAGRWRPHLSPPGPSSTQANLFRALAQYGQRDHLKFKIVIFLLALLLASQPCTGHAHVIMHRLRPARSCRICRLRRPQIGRRPGRLSKCRCPRDWHGCPRYRCYCRRPVISIPSWMRARLAAAATQAPALSAREAGRHNQRGAG
jgi:hypothetical protein